ncbi:MAG: helix-turn-helix domain-containing protein [Candidatus Woesearchaeota archaeon]|jgi:predicted transcriptional regulator
MSLDNYDREIIHFLANNSAATVNGIAEALGLGWATTKQHIIKLHSLGYLKWRKIDKKVYWRVVD